MASCMRCGNPTGGTYCADCRGWAERLRSLLITADRDAELLAQADVQKLRKAEIARRTGVSRMAVGQRLRRARRRQQERALMGGG